MENHSFLFLFFSLTEIEFKCHLLKKDPYAYDDTATAFGRGMAFYLISSVF